MATNLVFENGTVAELEMDKGVPSLTFQEPWKEDKKSGFISVSREIRREIETSMGDNFLGAESCMGRCQLFLNFRTLPEVIDYLRGNGVKFSIKNQ